MGRARAEELSSAARGSVGIKEGRKSLILDIQECLSLLKHSERFITTVEEEMSHLLKEIPYSWCILSIKGIGQVTAAGLIGEVGDFRQFHTLPEIIKYAGLDLFEISSGKRKGQKRISKRGRPLLRKLLFFASLNTVRKGGIMEEYYRECLKRGMLKIKALVAVSRKLLRIIFALVRDNSEFVRDFSKINPQLKGVA
ncbi:MAG: hypothetical protein DDT41_01600 [candidate division WS2 bacterium]|nr:hypothetical protein [Candidatus Psychracetigena formicireducens]